MAIAKRNPSATAAGKTAPQQSRISYQALIAPTDTPLISLLWGYRLLVQQRLIGELHGLFEMRVQISDKLGLSSKVEQLTLKQLEQVITKRLTELERQKTPLLPQALQSNIAGLATMVGLNATDQCLLAYAVLQKTDPLLNTLTELMPPLRQQSLVPLLANMLALPAKEVAHSLSPNSALLGSGLVSQPESSNFTLDDAFEFVGSYFEHRLIAEQANPAQLLKDMLQPASAPTLALSHYPHLRNDLDITLPYLKKAISSGQKGVNILLYGPPGTGKSELARVVAKHLKLPLFEVTCEDEDGEDIRGFERLRAYRLAQRCLANSRNLLVFDEIEDVFNCEPFSRAGRVGKGWMNRMLEQNPVPCFWISNNIDEMDNAFIRRFDQVIALDAPPKAQRAKQLAEAAPDLISQSDALLLAEHPALTPAIISRAAAVINTLPKNLKRERRKNALSHLMQQTLEAQGYAVPTKRNTLGSAYDASLVNCDVDLSSIVSGLQQAGSGRLCLYGPPGTGKTAFCHYLAKTLQLPLLTKSASELLGKFVGETEQNIAAAFAEAKADGAILLLDEVDSFLQDRRQARQSWEITAVNEMLVQMEAFDGIFVASTNLLHNLDQASLRRFDLKACFTFLTFAQSEQLLKRYCQQLTLSGAEQAASLLKQSQQLTPGDFAAVARQSRFRLMADASAFVKALLSEVALKTAGESKQIGFLQQN
ncbi:AAA family ATPase [Alishewanella longhuensis]